MLKVRLTKIGGDSLGITIPKAALRQLRWLQGDGIVLELGEDNITVTNSNRHSITPTLRKLDYGDAVTRTT